MTGGQRPEAWRRGLAGTAGGAVADGVAMARELLEATVLARLDATYGSASARGVRLAVPELLAARVGAVVRGALWLSDGRVLGVAVTVRGIDRGVADVRAVVDAVLPVVPVATLDERVADALARERGHRPASVRVAHPLPGLAGASVRGRLRAPDGSGIGLTVVTTAVAGASMTYEAIVDAAPDTPPRAGRVSRG